MPVLQSAARKATQQRLTTPRQSPPSKRQKTSLHISDTLVHEHAEPADARAFTPPAPAQPDTPIHPSSSSRPQSRPTQSQHSSSHQVMNATLTAAVAKGAKQRTTSLERAPMKREEMESMLREEIDLAVYQYPDFTDEFLAIPDPARRKTVLDALAAMPLFSHNGKAWSIDCRDLERVEGRVMHEAMAHILNAIGLAAFAPDQFRPVYQEIVPLHTQPLRADDPNDTDTVPDLVQAAPGGPDNTHHWGDVHFFAECKGANQRKKPDEQMSEALLQLARYARATLIHQIHRLHVFSVAVCNTTAIFVRIGRTGIIHSPPIDLREDFKTISRAAAGLFALAPDSFGYDSRFYYWPPLTGQTNDHLKSREFRVKTGKKRWTVLEIICQRKCLVGRATLALSLSRISNRRERAVLKGICRDESRADEGENLTPFKGCHGICQHRWNQIGASTAVRKKDTLSTSPFMKSFYPSLPDAEVTRIRSDAQGSTGASVRSVAARTSRAKNQQCRDEPPEDRVHSLILVDEGVGLWRIKKVPHLFAVLRDSVVGLATIVERGKVHRDVSEGNILYSRLPPGDSEVNHADAPGAESTVNADEDSNSEADSDTTYATLYFDQDSDGRSDTTADTELDGLLDLEEGVIHAETLPEYVGQRYKGPWCAGRLYDLEFMVKRDRSDNEARGKARTGTPAFISAQLLLATNKQPVRHTFLHDLESIFWVLVWTVATHVEPEKVLSEEAQQLIDSLSNRDDKFLGLFKRSFIAYPAAVHKDIRQLGNGWEKAATAAQKFAAFLRTNIYEKEGDQISGSDDENITNKDNEAAHGDAEPWAILKSVIDIFDQQIAQLE
ncbi:hypothetical protein FRC10_001613 [Ceratobasidium sp. 414]|nr:hypothetical protein FRC10_001613 [Ceratobasidium sp. 414]